MLKAHVEQIVFQAAKSDGDEAGASANALAASTSLIFRIYERVAGPAHATA